MEFLAVGIALIIGVFIGMFIGKSHLKRGTMGWLRVDHSEPDEPTRLFLELKSVTPEMIAQEKFVMFEVINESYISHN